jgi:integrase
MTTVSEVEFGQLDDLVPDWARSLRARNKSPKTIRGYSQTAEIFLAFLREKGMPTSVDKLGREHVEAFIEDQLARWKPTTALTRYGGLLQLFKWAVEEGEIRESPMARMKPPSVPEVAVPVVGDDDLRKLLKTCEGKKFEDARDLALFRLFIDTGCRLSEIVNLRVEDLDRDLAVVHVVGKGSRPRAAPYGPGCGSALDRYWRARKRHPRAISPSLWLGPKGGLTDSGVAQLLRRRCDQAAIARLHPHQFRHTAAHAWLAAGGNEGDAMRLFGWKSRQMLARYGASAAEERARDAYRRILPGDRL